MENNLDIEIKEEWIEDSEEFDKEYEEKYIIPDESDDIDDLLEIKEECIEDTEEFDEEHQKKYIKPDESDDIHDVLETSDNQSDSEDLNCDDDELCSTQQSPGLWFGKDGTKWMKSSPPRNVQTQPCKPNLMTNLSGPKKRARTTKTVCECFELYLNGQIITEISNCTNLCIKEIQKSYGTYKDVKGTDEIEVKCLLGILYLAGVAVSDGRNIEDLWRTDGTGMEAVYLSMPYNRFQFLLRCLRFDEKCSRDERNKIDQLAEIRKVFETFVENCQSNYTPSKYLTIDEQLLAFNGKCGFQIYIPNQPTKCGIKIFALVDCKTMYTVNLEINVGVQPDGPYKVSTAADAVVKRIIEPVKGTDRNISMDKEFTSYSLAMDLLQNHKLTVVGTLKKNERQIPESFIYSKNRTVYSSLFGFTEHLTLVSYCPKKGNIVLALSSMHHDAAIDASTGIRQKPELITFYNKSKDGVNTLDHMCAQYNVSRNTRSWTSTVFFYLMNIAVINALNVYVHNNPDTRTSRREFIYDLSAQLIRPQAVKRFTVSQMPQQLKQRLSIFLGVDDEKPDSPSIRQERKDRRVGRCYICPRKRNKSTRKHCVKCTKFVCAVHWEIICKQCASHEECEDTEDSS